MLDKKVIINELQKISAKVEALISVLQSEESSIVATVEEIRKVAVLEEIERLGGSATPSEISEIAKKWGKTPSSTAGYYSGKLPSLEADGSKRKLTSQGEKIVKNYREQWGEDWVERVPLDIVGNPNAKVSEIVLDAQK